MGESLGLMVRAQCGQKQPDTAALGATLAQAFDNLALDYELEVCADRATARFGRCPIYDGLAASGMDPADIRKVCESFSATESRKLHKMFPKLSETTKVRDRAEDACVEEFLVSK